ncbi:unnamed protein product [Porites evermanni]|uniref:Uncharacterized protein n=1 Tax=Porites evermanni TaxID=104178 RepID=A0ABN8SSW9_9CNID|nr:unnamed protein product [Porites evermanni]
MKQTAFCVSYQIKIASSCSDPGFGSKSPLVLSVVTLRTWILIFVRGVGSAMPHPFPFLSKRLKIDYKAIDDRMQQLAHASEAGILNNDYQNSLNRRIVDFVFNVIIYGSSVAELIGFPRWDRYFGRGRNKRQHCMGYRLGGTWNLLGFPGGTDLLGEERGSGTTVWETVLATHGQYPPCYDAQLSCTLQKADSFIDQIEETTISNYVEYIAFIALGLSVTNCIVFRIVCRCIFRIFGHRAAHTPPPPLQAPASNNLQRKVCGHCSKPVKNNRRKNDASKQCCDPQRFGAKEQ